MSGKKPTKPLDKAEAFFKRLSPQQRAAIIADIQKGARIVAEHAVAGEREALLERELPVVQARIAPAIDFLKWDLEKRIEQRKTDPNQSLHIHIGDFNHASPLSRLVQIEAIQMARAYGDATTTGYGQVAMVLEDTSKDKYLKTEYEKIMRGGPKAAAAYLDNLETQLRKQPITSDTVLRYHGYRKELEMWQGGISAIFPDPRGEHVSTQPQMTLEEATAFIQWNEAWRKADAGCEYLVSQAYIANLTPEQKQLLEQAQTKYKSLSGDDSLEADIKLDRTIANRTLDELKQGTLLVARYGGTHYLKDQDLNEHIGGTHLAVVPNAYAQHATRITALSRPTSVKDFPKAAIYLDPAVPTGQRLLIMDKDTLMAWSQEKLGKPLTPQEAEDQVRANRTRFIGLDPAKPELFAKWEQARDGDIEAQKEVVTWLDVSAAEKLACEPQVQAAVANLKAGRMGPGPMGPGASAWRERANPKNVEGQESSPSTLQTNRGGSGSGRGVRQADPDDSKGPRGGGR